MNNEAILIDESHDSVRRSHGWIYIVLLILIPVAVFISGVNYPFMLEWDDSGLITENTRLLPTFDNFIFFLDHVTFTQMIYSPALMYSLMLDRLLFDLNPLGYHMHNLLLHCTATLLLYGIVRHLGVRSHIAFCVALMWAIHPQRVESVIWISERKDVLAGAFSFGAILTFMRSFDRNKMPCLAIVLLLLAMATKPSTLTLPAVMVVYAVCKRREWKSVKYLIPVVTAVIAFYVYSYIVCHTNLTGTAETMPRLALVPLHNAFWYLITAVIPFELNPIYPRVGFDMHAAGILLTGTILAASGIVLLWKYKPPVRDVVFKVLPFPAAWLCCFLPVSAIMVRFTNTDYCDRYNYLLSAIVWTGIGVIAEKMFEQLNITALKTVIIAAGAICIAAAYALLTVTYIPFWQDTKILFLKALEAPVPNVKAIDGLGRVGLRRNDHEAMEMAGSLFINAASIRQPDTVNAPRAEYYTGVFFSGMALLKSDKKQDALAVFRIAETAYYKNELQIYTSDEYLPFLWNGLATCYLSAGKPYDALRCLKIQQQLLKPDSADSCFCLGLIAFIQNDLKLARQEWTKANSLRPNDANIQLNLQALEKRIAAEERQNQPRTP